MINKRFRLLSFLVASLAVLNLIPVQSEAQTTKFKIKTAVNPGVSSNLALLVAFENGYFASEGVDLTVQKYNGSSVTQMPFLARGDIDIALIVAGPGLFNQQTDGFDTKLVASVSEPNAEWQDSSWLLVRKDLWDSGLIRRLSDLKGRVVDGGTAGSANSMLLNQALLVAGLTRNDVKYSSKIRAADGFAAFRNNAVDVLSSVEPTVGEMVEQGLAVRLASSHNVMPWYQESYYAASSDWLKKNGPAATAFLKAYLHGVKDIISNGPKWSLDHAKIMAKWSGIPIETITKLPSPPYFGQQGEMRLEALVKQQAFWVSDGFVKTPIDAASLIEDRYLAEARK